MLAEIKSEIRGEKEEMAWNLIKEIPDPEIPVITISDLGILRNVKIEGEKVIVSITPTYSGCPAMDTIASEIKNTLRENGFENSEVKYDYTAVWTTDWIPEEAKERLRKYGIAPPQLRTQNSKLQTIKCPRCGSEENEMISFFGSTACKALYRCLSCKEPFDYFKCH
jgi:ring-1,2-phenylacetyl-CoA epoxidase subunit PaaD